MFIAADLQEGCLVKKDLSEDPIKSKRGLDSIEEVDLKNAR